MKMIVKRFLALLLVCSTLACSAGCGAIRLFQAAQEMANTPSPRPTLAPVTLPDGDHADIRFSDMTYVRPDISLIEEKLDALKEAIDGKKPAAELMGAYEEIQRLYNEADSAMSLAYLLYAFDVTKDTYEAEYTGLESALTKLDLSMTEVSIALFESSREAETLARERLGEAYVDAVYLGESLNDARIQDLLAAETELTVEYDRLTASFTLLDRGKRWTLDDILNDSALDYPEFSRLYAAYCDAFNQRAGAIFIEQLGIRHQIAQTLGYGSYAAYGYDLYGRDYTVLDAKRLHYAVKKHIVPVYLSANEDTDDLYDLYDASFSLEPFIDALSAAAVSFAPEVAEAMGFMLKNDLYDAAVSSKKMSGSFTTYISQYGAPFLYTQWTASSTNPTTFIHELGHFANYYLNPSVGWSVSDSLDLAEVDSQALELLMTAYYDSIYGAFAQAAEQDRLLDCMYAILAGCMEDEFQQAVYADPSMTLEEMNGLYLELAREYGFDELYGYTGTEWTLIPHTFQSPLYYISYAASMLPALELWEAAQTDPTAASEAYLKILKRDPYAGFRQILADNGLSDVFSEETVRRLAGVIADNF